MMNITIISVGKLKEKYLKQAIDEYSKRLTRYCKIDSIELPDEKHLIMHLKRKNFKLSIRKDSLFYLR